MYYIYLGLIIEPAVLWAAADEMQLVDFFSKGILWHFQTCAFCFLLPSGRELDEETDTQYKATDGKQLSWTQRLETRNPASVKVLQNFYSYLQISVICALYFICLICENECLTFYQGLTAWLLSLSNFQESLWL